MKHLSALQLGAITAVLVSVAPLVSLADDLDKKTVVKLDQPTEVPGITLQPGTYVIKLLNSSSNRHIVEIMNERMDHLYALAFTAAAQKVEPSSKDYIDLLRRTAGSSASNAKMVLAKRSDRTRIYLSEKPSGRNYCADSPKSS